jgi:hypothetical protein
LSGAREIPSLRACALNHAQLFTRQRERFRARCRTESAAPEERDSNTRSSVFRHRDRRAETRVESRQSQVLRIDRRIPRDDRSPISDFESGDFESQRSRQGPFSRGASERDGRASLRRMQSAQKCSLERGKKGTEEEVGREGGKGTNSLSRRSCFEAPPPPPPPQRALTRLSRLLRS